MKHIITKLLIFGLLQTLVHAEDKLALLIGNSAYKHIEVLHSPQKDIPALARKLRGLGFTVMEYYDLDEKSMKKVVKTFKTKLLRLDNPLALFYYSGHGSQAYGESYLIPIDADTRDEADVEADAIKVETIAVKMASARTKASILFLDACRDVPTGTMGGTKGLGQVKHRPSGSLIVYSTSKGTTARDNRLFNQVVLEKLALNLPLSNLANQISYSVNQKTNGSQTPEVFVKSLPEICLSGSCREGSSSSKNSAELAKLRAENARLRKQKVKPTRVTTKSLKWISPSKSVCKKNGGKMTKGLCKARWKEAKAICRASGGRLPARIELVEVISECGGNTEKTGRNPYDSNYQRCYKKKGFIGKELYWSSTADVSSSRTMATVMFYYGYNQYYYVLVANNAVACVKDR